MRNFLMLMVIGVSISACNSISALGLVDPFATYATPYGETNYNPMNQNPFSTNWYFPLN